MLDRFGIGRMGVGQFARSSRVWSGSPASNSADAPRMRWMVAVLGMCFSLSTFSPVSSHKSIRARASSAPDQDPETCMFSALGGESFSE